MLQKLFPLTATAAFVMAMTACSNGGSSSTATTSTQSTSSLTLPSSLEVVTSNSGNNSSSLNTAFASAFNDNGTDYSTDEQEFYIWNESTESVELVNNILCFVEQFRPIDFVNQGPYRALVNEGRCFGRGQNQDSSATAGQSSSAAGGVDYVEVVINATRTDNSSPLEVSAWIPKIGDSPTDTQAIRFKATVSKGASSSDPFGQFTFNYNFFDNFTNNNAVGGGEVSTVNTPGSIGFTLYESSTRGSDTRVQSASVVMSADKTTGNAITSFSEGANGRAYALAYNPTHVLLQNANDVISLPYKLNDNSGSCLSRTQFNEAVWDYDLYDLNSGERVAVNSGMPFKYDSDNDSSLDAFGYIGYHGLWTQEEGALSNGDTVVVEQNDAAVNYTVRTAPGRLIKNSIETLSLANVRGVDFYLWDESAVTAGYDQWVVNYLTTADDGAASDGFYKVRGLQWGSDGPQLTDVTDSLINVPSGETLYLFSNQLGGNVQYLSGDTNLTYFARQIVNGSETGTGEILESGSLNLTCYDRCPIGTLAASDLQNYSGSNSPYLGTSGSHSYSFAVNGINGLTLVRSSNSEPVQYASGLSKTTLETANSPWSWGVNSGPMVPASVAATLTSPADIYDSNKVTVFYTWETGLNSWNQLQVVADNNGDIVSFDPPVSFSYTHSNGNDRSANAGNFAGKTYLLNYNGSGNLHGIPRSQTSDGRWYPQFNIDDGVALGPNGRYVIKARKIEQSMASATGQCTSLTLQDPAVAVPTSLNGSANIGSMPAVTSDPVVIDGVLQNSQNN